MPAAQRAAADAAIAARLDAIVAGLAPMSVAGYWPMRGEPELIGAFTRWHAAGIVVALPCVVGAEAPLQFLRWEPGMPMSRGTFGTREPSHGEAVEPAVLLLPCVGFERRGYRLGYGGGYYDRTLAARPGVVTIGVAYDECELADFAPQPHDRPVDWLVTQTRTLQRAT